MKNNKIILAGGGGHCKVIIDAIKLEGKWDICGIVDPGIPKGTLVMGVPVLGSDEVLKGIFENGIVNALISVGSVGNCGVRKKLYNGLKRIGFSFPVVKHPSAVVASDVTVEEGTFIAARVVINTGTKIGKNVIVNTSSSIDHDCEIGDFVHIAPGVTLSGGVKIEDETHVGTGAKVTQYLDIGRKCIIGAGQTIRHHMADGEKSFDKNKVLRKKGSKIFIIAEAGANHNGKVSLAKKMVDAAKKAGADAVKFQTFKAERLATRYAPKSRYQKKTTLANETQFAMLKKLELDVTMHKKLMAYCEKKGVLFLSSPFDLESIKLLDNLGLEIFKIPSGEINNLPYLRKIGALGKKVIMSSGMAELKEIKNALQVLSGSGTARENITVLHCNTEYPTPMEDVNLLAMLTIRDAFNVNVGYSDHTLGIEAAIAAAALGASVIEKHFTLDKNMRGPDHKASLEPAELKTMVTAIRNVEKIFGNGIKRPSRSESKNIKMARKSIVTAKDVKKGELFTGENITTKRPATGISPIVWDKVIGRTARRDFKKDELVEL